MFRLPHNCPHLTCQQGNVQNPSSQASTVRELRTSKYTSWIQKRKRNQKSNSNIHWNIEKAKEFQKNICFIDCAKAFDCVDHNYSFHNKLWKILKMMGTSVASNCNPMNCSPPGSIVHGILQARTLGWVVIPFPRNVTNRTW